MAFRGHIGNGPAVLDEPVAIPEETAVTVEPLETVRVPTLAEQLGDVISTVDELPEKYGGESRSLHSRETEGMKQVFAVTFYYLPILNTSDSENYRENGDSHE